MRAVLMAGGSGTRLRPLTCDLPKPMVPILNRPIAEHIINLLKRHRITEIIATLHYLPDAMRDYFQDGGEFGVQMTYSVEEDQPLGTAGCVKNIEELLDETFLVISGDSITDFDLNAAIRFHYDKQSKATLVLTRVPEPMEFGVVITDEQNRIRRFLEKPSTSEVFSDTINTGIYILEPSVLDYLPPAKETDFSKDLFPLLLEKNEPMYGYIAEGYWCDVGHLDVYREVQYDALQGQVKLVMPYEERKPGLWVGRNTFIDKSVVIEKPVLIGHNCWIGPRVKIEAGTIIGDNITVGTNTTLKRPIIWNGTLIGEDAHLRACVICRGSRIDRRAQVLEAAVVGSLCVVGEEAQVSPNVRVWPSKIIESGAMLNTNLIWGEQAKRNLFGQRGVQGLANVEITPEFAVKLGATYGSVLKPGSTVSISRDQRSVSRMVSRSLIAGLMSVGINVLNFEATAIPIARTVAPTFAVVGGVHIRLSPDRTDYILIEFFDEKGINISKTMEKKIEGAYFKEDLRRVQIPEIGNVTYVPQAVDIYSEAFEKYMNTEAIRHSTSKVVIDYVYAVSGAILPQILAKFGCDAVVLNASLSQTSLSGEEREQLLEQLGRVVSALSANFGVQVSANGEQLILVDENGIPIQGELLTAVMVDLMLTSSPRGTVVIPVNASSAVESIASRYEGRVIRTKANPTALMEACRTNSNVVLGGSGEMGFIFPQLNLGFDAMFCIAKVIEMLTIQERSLGEIKEGLPEITHRSSTVRCPWSVKGGLMRYLVEHHQPSQLELLDGVKILKSLDESSWILILPDAGEPLIHIIANSDDPSWVERVLVDYHSLITHFVHQSQTD